MRKIATTYLLLLFAFAAGHAQNWEAFRSGRTYHFQSDTATGLPDVSVHFDSVGTLGPDSAFSVARRFVFPVDTSLRNQPMFCGREILARPDGQFQFKNPINVVVPTQAGLGTTFTLDSVSGLSAAVSRVYQTTLFGLAVDSVKVFTTLSLDSLVLSKAHGILEWPASLGGARYLLTGIQEEHKGDTLPGFDGFFDLPIGDLFYQSSRVLKGVDITQENFRVRFGVDTSLRQGNGFIVTYSGIMRFTERVNGNLTVDQGSTISGSLFIADRPNTVLDKSHHEQVRAPGMMKNFVMPAPWATYVGTAAVDSLNQEWNGMWTTMTFQKIAGNTELHVGRSNGITGWLYSGVGGDTCAASADHYFRSVIREGFGVTHVEWGGFDTEGTFDLVGSIINGDTVGTVFSDDVLLAASGSTAMPIDWTVSPNPAHDVLAVRWSDAKPGTLKLSDLSGRVVLEAPARSLEASLDVQALPAGMYLLTLTQGSSSATKRIAITR